jgi:hypothetical protein
MAASMLATMPMIPLQKQFIAGLARTYLEGLTEQWRT